MKASIFTACMLATLVQMTALAAFGQPPATTPPVTVKKEETKTESVFVVVCDGKPGQMVVLDSNGKWIPNVKNIEIKLEVGQPATITCVIYEGVLKPSNPPVKTWSLSQMKTMSNSEFQKLVDSLQTDPSAIKTIKE